MMPSLRSGKKSQIDDAEEHAEFSNGDMGPLNDIMEEIGDLFHQMNSDGAVAVAPDAAVVVENLLSPQFGLKPGLENDETAWSNADFATNGHARRPEYYDEGDGSDEYYNDDAGDYYDDVDYYVDDSVYDEDEDVLDHRLLKAPAYVKVPTVDDEAYYSDDATGEYYDDPDGSYDDDEDTFYTDKDYEPVGFNTIDENMHVVPGFVSTPLLALDDEEPLLETDRPLLALEEEPAVASPYSFDEEADFWTGYQPVTLLDPEEENSTKTSMAAPVLEMKPSYAQTRPAHKANGRAVADEWLSSVTNPVHAPTGYDVQSQSDDADYVNNIYTDDDDAETPVSANGAGSDTCLFCGYPLMPGKKYCQNCAAPVKPKRVFHGWVTYHRNFLDPDAADRNNPNLVPCRHCGRPAYRRAHACPKCGIQLLKPVYREGEGVTSAEKVSMPSKPSTSKTR